MKLKTLLIIASSLLCLESLTSQGLIIDHFCTQLSEIPLEWIDSAQLKQKYHYCHTSHGGQLTTGLERVEDMDNTYDHALWVGFLPTQADALCVFDGNENCTYVLPEHYFKTHEGMNRTRSTLTNNPTLNVSQFAFCSQMNYWTDEQVQAYLDSMTVLETEFPDVRFVYMTGNAQTGPGNHYNQNLDEGYIRFLRNEQIRNYCIQNHKILYDFADIDCWWLNPVTEEWEFSTYDYWNGIDTVAVPFEHPQYNIEEARHTSFENCENKGKAVWWLMAWLAGWQNSIELDLKVYLEGPFDETEMSTHLNSNDKLPLSQPYFNPPWNYAGSETVSVIPNEDVVDWILVELRDAPDAGLADEETILARKAAFLLKDGNIVDLDGSSQLAFDPPIAVGAITNSLFVVVRHRNHIDMMSANALSETDGSFSYDFTTDPANSFGGNLACKNISSSVNPIYGMIGGDANCNGDISLIDKVLWIFNVGENTEYEIADLNLDGTVDNIDKNKTILGNIGYSCQVP